MSNKSVLTAKGIKKYLGEGAGRIMALKGVDIDLRRGELTLLMGPSGSGKTTLLSILGCILSPTEGNMMLEDKELTGLEPEALARIRRDHIGFVFQQYNLFPTLTARENVMLSMDVRGMPTSESRQLAEEALETVGLGDKLNNYPKQLSGGEQQRTAVARALIGEPTIILADEPTAALDSKNGQAVMQLLSEIAEQKDSAVLAVTHDPRTEPYAHRIIRIEDGLIVGDEHHVPDYKSSAGKRAPYIGDKPKTGEASTNGTAPSVHDDVALQPVVSAAAPAAIARFASNGSSAQNASYDSDNYTAQNTAPLNPARGKRSRPAKRQKR